MEIIQNKSKKLFVIMIITVLLSGITLPIFAKTYTSSLTVGDKLKFTATSYKVYSSNSGCKSKNDEKVKRYLKTNEEVTIKAIDGNSLKIADKEFIYYGETGSKYFKIVKKAETKPTTPTTVTNTTGSTKPETPLTTGTNTTVTNNTTLPPGNDSPLTNSNDSSKSSIIGSIFNVLGSVARAFINGITNGISKLQDKIEENQVQQETIESNKPVENEPVKDVEPVEPEDKTEKINIIDTLKNITSVFKNIFKVKVRKISLSEENVELFKMDTITLTVSHTPSYASAPNISFKSEDETVATVSSNGTIKAIDEGETYIIAKTDSGLEATCKVIVNLKSIEKLEKETKDTSVDQNKTVTLKYKVTPSDANTSKLKWTSSDKTIATVEKGVVKGIKEGPVTIKLTDENTKKEISWKITVNKKAEGKWNLSDSTQETTYGEYVSQFEKTFTVYNQTYISGWSGSCNRAASACIVSGYTNDSNTKIINYTKQQADYSLPKNSSYFEHYGLEMIDKTSQLKNKDYRDAFKKTLEDGNQILIYIKTSKYEGKSGTVWTNVKHWLAILDYRINSNNVYQIRIGDSGSSARNKWVDLDEFMPGGVSGLDEIVFVGKNL